MRKSRKASEPVIVGGGPAGLMAAGQAAGAGVPVLLLERMGRLGNKLRMTGNGRCNLTNLTEPDHFLQHFAAPCRMRSLAGGLGTGGSHLFLRNAFARFFAPDLLDLLSSLGVQTRAEPDGRVFPASNDARQIVEALARWAGSRGVQIWLNSRAGGLRISGGRLEGLVLEDGRQIAAGAVVIATGGASYPQTGSSGDGYRLAEQAGHRLVPIRPALVPLVIPSPEPRALMGLALAGVEARLLLDGQELARAAGEMLFTHYGVSGPLVLTLSRTAVDWLGRGRLELSVNLHPALSPEEVDARLRADLDRYGKRVLLNVLNTWHPDRLAAAIVARTGVPATRPAHRLTAAERRRVREMLQDLRFTVTGHRPLIEAMVTAGGVDTREVDPATMASRRVRGLYFAGEVLDVQADTGGYNLQAAFSTGYLAGQAAARYLMDQNP